MTLTHNDIAERLHISPQKAQKLIRAEMRHVRTADWGNEKYTRVVRVEDFEAWIAAKTCAPTGLGTPNVLAGRSRSRTVSAAGLI